MLLESIEQKQGTLSDIFSAFPDVAVPILELCETIMRGPSSFTVAERELIAAFVSEINKCSYCATTHTEAAEVLGFKQGIVKELVDDISAADVDDKIKPVLSYVDKLCRNPNDLNQEDVDAAKAAGWDETAIHDAITVCAMFQFFNHYVMGIGLPGGEQVSGRGKMLSKHGYAVMIDMLKLRDKAKTNE